MTNEEKLLEALKVHLSREPQLGKGVYVAAGAAIVGDVILGDFSSVWYNATLRADIQRIEVGPYSNIQDGVVVHVTEQLPCVIGSWCTIGHSAIVHACRIEDEVLVGIGAVVLDGACIGKRSIVGAQALVPPGMQIPPGSLVLGVPARVVRTLSEEEQRRIRTWAEHYLKSAAICLERGLNLHPLCKAAGSV